MVTLPPSPISPAAFMQEFVPKAFAESEVSDAVKGADVKLGVRLVGEGGGEWTFHIEGGALQVEAGSRNEAAFTVVQSVEHWRGALWEDRGGVFGKQAANLFRPGEAASAPGPGGLGSVPDVAALGQLRALSGRIRMVVTDDGSTGDWTVDVVLGPGEIPAEPTTTVTVSAADAAAMERGELNPFEAMMADRIQVAGDIALIMQMQAILMQAAAGGSAGSDA